MGLLGYLGVARDEAQRFGFGVLALIGLVAAVILGLSFYRRPRPRWPAWGWGIVAMLMAGLGALTLVSLADVGATTPYFWLAWPTMLTLNSLPLFIGVLAAPRAGARALLLALPALWARVAQTQGPVSIYVTPAQPGLPVGFALANLSLPLLALLVALPVLLLRARSVWGQALATWGLASGALVLRAATHLALQAATGQPPAASAAGTQVLWALQLAALTTLFLLLFDGLWRAAAPQQDAAGALRGVEAAQ